MNRSILLAILVAVAVVGWMLSGQFGTGNASAPGGDNTPDRLAENTESKPLAAMKVQTRRQSAEQITREVIVQGQVEPVRVLHMRAETAGSVREKRASKGQQIRPGQTIVQLEIDTREANLTVAKANEVQALNEFEAARKLQQKGLQSKVTLESAAARLEAARAQVKAAELEIGNATIVAPFAGRLNDMPVEVGDFIDRGGLVATLVDQSSLLITGNIPQQSVSRVSTGQRAVANLITGEQLEGNVSFVASMADSATRSFRVEVKVEDPPASIRTGISAEISIPTETLMAHLISPAILALGDSGELGVKAVDGDNQVVFHPVEVAKTESRGAWVTGIPDNADIITLGQGFVRAGETVEAIADTTAAEAQ